MQICDTETMKLEQLEKRKTRPFEDRHVQDHTEPLFGGGLEEQVLLAVHLLGKPTAAQLHRLFADQVSTHRQMQGILRRLSTGPDRALQRIKPLDIASPIRSLPFVYLDTRRSRRLIEAQFGVPYRRVPPVPSRDWRFLRHDVELVDDLIAFELTARRLGLPFGYQPHFDATGAKVYPKVTISWDGLTHTLRPEPDKTLIVGNTHLILEHDCGEETVECGNIIRDATLGRKHLVYDQLFRAGHLKAMGWGRTLIVYIIDSKRGNQKASRKRIKRCLETMPERVDRKRMFFIDRQALEQADGDLTELLFLRGCGTTMPLPCLDAINQPPR
jgi:hypothetical protein